MLSEMILLVFPYKSLLEQGVHLLSFDNPAAVQRACMGTAARSAPARIAARTKVTLHLDVARTGGHPFAWPDVLKPPRYAC